LTFTGCQKTINHDGLIKINEATLKFELAESQVEKTQGLSNRNRLAKDEGMLFIYSEYSLHSFWMKGMLFPIDIIWLQDNLIIDITANVPIPTSTNLIIYKPNKPVNKILEVNAGWVQTNNVKIGDSIEIN